MLLLPTFLFIIGIIFGSFLAAFTYRFPKGLSNARGRSFCDHCKHQIAWRDNIPLLSFMLLGGRCRDCGKKISWRYPLIELATGIIFALSAANIFALAILAILEIIFIIDLEHQLIPDVFVFYGLILSTLVLTLFDISIFPAFLGGFCASSFLLLIYLATSGRGMGLGDVKFAVLGGVLVGLKLTAIWLFVSFLTGALVGIILILVKKVGLKNKIAFGPFLILAIPLTIIWGGKFLSLLGLNF